MNQTIALMLCVLMAGCASTPSAVNYNGKTVATYGTSAGCGTLLLKQDCSSLSGATRKIEIDGHPLRISGSDDGKIVFIMSMPKFLPDEQALNAGSNAIEAFLLSKEVAAVETKVMYGSGKIFGIHTTFDADAYTLLKEFSIKK